MCKLPLNQLSNFVQVKFINFKSTIAFSLKEGHDTFLSFFFASTCDFLLIIDGHEHTISRSKNCCSNQTWKCPTIKNRDCTSSVEESKCVKETHATLCRIRSKKRSCICPAERNRHNKHVLEDNEPDHGHQITSLSDWTCCNIWSDHHEAEKYEETALVEGQA